MDSYPVPIWAYIVSSRNKKCCCESHCEHIDVTNLNGFSVENFIIEILPLLVALTTFFILVKFVHKFLKG